MMADLENNSFHGPEKSSSETTQNVSVPISDKEVSVPLSTESNSDTQQMQAPKRTVTGFSVSGRFI